MARNLDLAALRSFIAVAETGGVTKAAQRLHLTQSGVSMQIKRLEDALGLDLLTREGRGVALTKCGEELLAQAKKLIALNDEIWARMTAPAFVGELTLGMPHDIVHPFAAMVLKSFDRDHPNVKVSLISPPSATLLEMLDEGTVDVILTTEFGCGAGGETLAQAPLVWVGAPGGRAWMDRPIPLAFDRRCIFRKPTFAALERAGLEWDWRIETANNAAEAASVAADLAICTLMRGALPHPLVEIEHDGRLPPLPQTLINLYHGAGPKDELITELAAYLRRAVSESFGPALVAAQ